LAKKSGLKILCALLFHLCANEARRWLQMNTNTDNHSRAQVAFGAVLFAVTQLPLYAVDYPQIADLPAHVARLHVLMNLDESPVLQSFYEHSFPIAPNMAMDLLVPPLAMCFGLLPAFKLFVSLSSLLMVTGAVALGRALHGGGHPLLLGSLLFVQSMFMHLGLLNYIMGLGVAFWLLSRIIRVPPTLHSGALVTGAAAVLCLYATHLSALGVYVLGVTGILLSRMTSHEGLAQRWSVANVAAFSLHLVPAGLLHMLVAQPRGTFEATDFPWIAVLVYKLLVFAVMPAVSISPFSLAKVPILAALGIGLLWAVRRDAIRFSREGRWIVAALAAAMLALPDAGFGSGLLAVRLALPLTLVLWVSMRVEGLGLTGWRRMAVACLIGVGGITGVTLQSWSATSAEHTRIRSAMAAIDEGSKVATVVVEPKPWKVQMIVYVGAWGVLDRSILLSNGYFRPFNTFWTSYREDAVSLAAKARTDHLPREPAPYGELCRDFDYVLVLGAPQRTEAYVPRAEKTVYTSELARIVQTDRRFRGRECP
jgi:hypothetical protein